MKTYTIEIHTKRLRKMLDKGNCNLCPAASRFKPENSPEDLWTKKVFPCEVCLVFVGLKYDYSRLPAFNDCPCTALGETRAIEITEKKLEEMGL